VPASGEELKYPVDVAVGPGGEIYVADIDAAALLRWSGDGFEVVAQGEGLPKTPLFGIRHIAPTEDGAVLASDPATMALYRITASGEITAIADDDGFVTPWGIAIDDSGAILAVDRVTQRLRRVRPGSIEDVATVRAPRAILAGGDGALHVLTDRNVLRMVNGGGEPLVQSPPFEFPHDFVRAPDGGFFVTDGYARCIWKISPEGRVSVHARGAPLVSPQGIALGANGDLLVADAHARTIFRVSGGGQIVPLGQ
jgi:sugar lactone lactonase YvrE